MNTESDECSERTKDIVTNENYKNVVQNSFGEVPQK